MDIAPRPGGEWEKGYQGGELSFLKLDSVLVGLSGEVLTCS